jgi:hypothetical protein
MLRVALVLIVGSCFLGGGSLALAQAEGEEKAEAGAPSVTYKKKTVYDFDDDLVEGELQRPDGEYIDTQRKAKHSSLIKIRADFIPEMFKSAEDI